MPVRGPGPVACIVAAPVQGRRMTCKAAMTAQQRKGMYDEKDCVRSAAHAAARGHAT